MTDEGARQPEAHALGVRHALLVYTSPAALFRRVEDAGTYGWALVTLLALVVLIGYVEVQTGLIDRVVQQRTEGQLADLERTQFHLVDRIELKKQMDDIRKQGDFYKLINRWRAIVVSPAYILASVLLIASCLYAVVALTGRKPEYHTLVSICVYAEFVELLAYALRLAMMLYYRTMEVDTSLGMLATSKGLAWLAAIDPFRVWFWALVAIGLTVTHQLSRRMAVVSCTLMCLVAMGIRTGMEYAQV
ncbi:MAG: YIP1 family protein [Phycisphaerae bacterium]|nr:YIP1 family protein [Phycisphaerae bacterium]